jgi:hypothetical protein
MSNRMPLIAKVPAITELGLKRLGRLFKKGWNDPAVAR